jgi:hypothetical protein
MKMWFVTLICFLFVYPAVSLAGEVSYSAIVKDTAGKVTVVHEGKRSPLDPGCLLYPGDRVEILKDGSLTIHYLESGQVEQWPGGLGFSIGITKSEPIHPRVIITNTKIVIPPRGDSEQGGTIILRSEGKSPTTEDSPGGMIMREEKTPIEPDNPKEIEVK